MKKWSLALTLLIFIYVGTPNTESTVSIRAYPPLPQALPEISSIDLTYTPTVRHSGVVVKKDAQSGLWIRSISNEKQHLTGIDGIVFVIKPNLKAGDDVAISITRILVSHKEKSTPDIFLQCTIDEWTLPKTIAPVLSENQKVISTITERLAMVLWSDSGKLLVARTTDNTVGPPLIISYICTSTEELIEGDRVYFLYGKTRLRSTATGEVLSQQVLFQISREQEPESDSPIRPTGTGTIDRSPVTVP